ncbi:MAG: lysostaphin resistance A-like protein [Myxococcota bacterium]
MIPIPESEPEAPITPGFAILLTLIVGFFQMAFLVTFREASEAAAPALLGSATILGFGLALYLAASRIPDPPGFWLGFVRPPPIAWSAALFLSGSVLLISEADNIWKRIFPLPEELSSAPQALPSGAGYALSLGLLLIVVRPLAQEILFRGLLQPHFVRAWGAARGVLFCAALNAVAFALLNPWSLASVLTMALVLGILRASTHSILPGLALHAGFGALTVLASYQVFGIPGFDDTSAPHTPLEWLAPAALMTGIGFGLCRSASALPPPAPPEDSGAPSEPHG